MALLFPLLNVSMAASIAHYLGDLCPGQKIGTKRDLTCLYSLLNAAPQPFGALSYAPEGSRVDLMLIRRRFLALR